MAAPNRYPWLAAHCWKLGYGVACAAAFIVPLVLYSCQPEPVYTPLTLRAGLRGSVQRAVPSAPSNDAPAPAKPAASEPNTPSIDPANPPTAPKEPDSPASQIAPDDLANASGDALPPPTPPAEPSEPASSLAAPPPAEPSEPASSLAAPPPAEPSEPASSLAAPPPADGPARTPGQPQGAAATPTAPARLDADPRCYYVEGLASFLDTPLKAGTIIISARSKGGNAHITHASIDGNGTGRFTSACIPRDYDLDDPAQNPREPKDPLARIELTMAMSVADLVPGALPAWVQTPITGSTTITRHGTGTLAHERSYVPRWAVALGIGVIVCGLYGSILGTRRLGRLASISASLGITLAAILMLGVIVSAYLYIISVYRDGGIVLQTSVGYLTRETFHEKIPPDWIFSLTLPWREATENRMVGFGAPLWVILLGSIGACVTAFQHLVRSPFDLDQTAPAEAPAASAGDKPANAGAQPPAPNGATPPATPPAPNDATPPATSRTPNDATPPATPPAPNDATPPAPPRAPNGATPPATPRAPAPGKTADEDVLSDEFSRQNKLTGAKADQLLSIAFAPLGSIFVYQALILLDFTEFVVIATIMLASGLSLNLLVTIASDRVHRIITGALAGKTDPPKP